MGLWPDDYTVGYYSGNAVRTVTPDRSKLLKGGQQNKKSELGNLIGCEIGIQSRTSESDALLSNVIHPLLLLLFCEGIVEWSESLGKVNSKWCGEKVQELAAYGFRSAILDAV